MDMALDEVSIHATPHFFQPHLPRRSRVIRPDADCLCSQIVAANRPKGVRRSSRRGGAKSQVLGNAPSNPSTRAKAAPASASAKTATTAGTQTSEKIIVSGLPVDVTEQQVKVRSNAEELYLAHTDASLANRSSSTLPSAPSAQSLFTTTPKVARRAWQKSSFQREATATRLNNSTTTGSLTEVSIDCFFFHLPVKSSSLSLGDSHRSMGQAYHFVHLHLVSPVCGGSGDSRKDSTLGSPARSVPVGHHAAECRGLSRL